MVFRFPKMSDATLAMRYINALIDEGARILLTKRITLAEEKKWLKRTISSLKNGTTLTAFGICGKEICAIGGVDRRFSSNAADTHVASYHISVAKAFRRLGLAAYISELVFQLAKKEWKTQILKSSYVADNDASAALHRKLGFKLVGKIPKATKYGNKYIDEVICYKEI